MSASPEMIDIAARVLIRLRDTRDAIADREQALKLAEQSGQKRKAARIRKRIADLRLEELCGRMVFGGRL